MRTRETNNGKNGGLLKGKPHTSKSGKPLGGIKAVVTDTGQRVELEGGEVIINKEASKKHWKELSRINQSAGGGVPILPPDEADDADADEYKKGGRTIEFNRNKLPNRVVYNYAKKIKEKYPKVWAMGGNIFGNEAFRNLERVIERGYWMDSEEWMFVKWQSFCARHRVDTRIAGIIANLKWLNKVDKGWDYMKNLIEEEIAKKYPEKKAKGGVVTYKDKYNKKYGYDKGESHTLSEVAKDTGVSKKGVQQIYNKGIGAYKTNPESVRPQVKSKEQWAMGRVYSAVMGGKAARVDAKELKMAKGGEMAKGVKKEAEHKSTLKELYERKIKPSQAVKKIAREHIQEDPQYYSKMESLKLQNGGGIDFKLMGVGGYDVSGLKDKLQGAGFQNVQILGEQGKPSTDPSTWGANFNVGDRVKIRIDYSTDKGNGASKVKYDSPDNSFTITKIEKSAAQPFKLDSRGNNVGGFIRPENPSGFLYNLSNNQSWEGKDLELLASTTSPIKSPSQPTPTRQNTAQLGDKYKCWDDKQPVFQVREIRNNDTLTVTWTSGAARYNYTYSVAEVEEFIKQGWWTLVEAGIKTTPKPQPAKSSQKPKAPTRPKSAKSVPLQDSVASFDLFLKASAFDVKEKPIDKSIDSIIDSFEKLLQNEGKYEKIVRN